MEAMAGTIREDLEEAQADWWQSLATRGLRTGESTRRLLKGC